LFDYIEREIIKSVIIHDISTEYQHNLKNLANVRDDNKNINPGIDNDRHIITLDKGKGDIQKIERMIKDILIKRGIDDYVVIQ